MPKLELINLEAQFKAAEAALAAARGRARPRRHDARRGTASSPTFREVGTAAFAFAGKEIAQIVALDPMLAVVEVSERKLAASRSATRPR